MYMHSVGSHSEMRPLPFWSTPPLAITVTATRSTRFSQSASHWTRLGQVWRLVCTKSGRLQAQTTHRCLSSYRFLGLPLEWWSPPSQSCPGCHFLFLDNWDAESGVLVTHTSRFETTAREPDRQSPLMPPSSTRDAERSLQSASAEIRPSGSTPGSREGPLSFSSFSPCSQLAWRLVSHLVGLLVAIRSAARHPPNHVAGASGTIL